MTTNTKLDKSTPDAVWKQQLTAQEFEVLRNKGTDRAGSGPLTDHFGDGVYKCAGCGEVLYRSETKFHSACGWPAFYDNVDGKVERIVDTSHGMRRVEITCANCGGHLGHVFEGEGYSTPTDVRHCVNSTSLKFEPKS